METSFRQLYGLENLKNQITMNQSIIICYRKIIDAQSASTWEQYVFEDSYMEFLMQFQFFNAERKYTTFSDFLNDNQNAERLQSLTSTSVTGYVEQLKNKIPDVKNVLGKTFLSFQNYRFEIIESAINNRAKHVVAINFYSEPITWLQTIGDTLLLALDNQPTENGVQTEMIKLQPFVSISSVGIQTHCTKYN